MLLAIAFVGAVPLGSATDGTFRNDDLTFKSGPVTLACTLSTPAGSGPFRAAVLLSGSGPQNRDSELLGFRPFKIMAEYFVQHGIAVLRCDDRGVGGSTGSIADATTEQFADDALAAVEFLRQRADIQKSGIGLVGHSEGAITAAIAAATSPHVAFIVWMAGSAVPGAEILQMQAAALARAGGAASAAVDDILRKHAALLGAIKDESSDETLMELGRSLVASQLAAMPEAQRRSLGDGAAFSEALMKQTLGALKSRWMRFFINFDPSTVLRRVACPVFAAFGTLDLQVPAAANRIRLEESLTEARNNDVTVTVYPEANHLFMRAVTGQLAEYATLPKTFVPALLADLAAWIARR
jgi:pimeloyl-ACP methyl ester carboxylesterase